ncbi:MAG TPA: 7-cyano-7-deazaguanine synthase QueC [Pirellulales bacterium]|jgi:7-cyano-7-deazaguanine synthase|nr:7-cyano-7-deazaguanine synthase QueC [Pirellulales bacterium]
MPGNSLASKNRPAVVLLSGGLDSATTLALAKADRFDVFAISFRYGQRHGVELAAAAKVAAAAGVREHRVVDIDLSQFGGSALTSDVPVPTGRTAQEMSEGIPITYVPARNTVFLALSLAWAEVLGASDIYIGVNAVDYSGYPDCRPEYIAAFERLANLATKAGVEGQAFRIHAPLIAMTKAEIIRQGLKLGVDYSLTRSCYSPTASGRSCGSCDACLLRLAGFREAGTNDPIEYEVRG